MKSGYYVSTIRADTRKYRLLAGPFDLPPTQDQIQRVSHYVIDKYPWSIFDSFGSMKVTTEGELPEAAILKKHW